MFVLMCFLVLQVSLASVAYAKPQSEKFGDWTLLCPVSSKSSQHKAANSKSSSPADEKDRCRLFQRYVVKDKPNATALLVTVVMSGKTKSPVAVVSVPKDVYLAPGIELAIDGKAKFKVLFETCNDSGCHGGFALSGAIIKAFKKGAVARHRIYDFKRRKIDVPVSLKGFTKGIKRLKAVSG